MYKYGKDGKFEQIKTRKPKEIDVSIVKSLEMKIAEMTAESTEKDKVISALKDEIALKDTSIAEMTAELYQIRLTKPD